MKKILSLMILVLAFSALTAFAQEKKEMKKPTEADKIADFDADGTIKRGAALAAGGVKKVSLAKVLTDPAKYAGKTVRVQGVIVRSCQKEGCWAELAPDANSKSVRVKMKDHSFFIPLQSAGFKAKADGVFTVKTLSKEQVEHMIKDDGAKFDRINADGTVTEISFEATGIELRRS